MSARASVAAGLVLAVLAGAGIEMSRRAAAADAKKDKKGAPSGKGKKASRRGAKAPPPAVDPVLAGAKGSAIPDEALEGAARAALAHAAQRIVARLSAEESPGLLFEPIAQRQVVDWKSYEVRFRKVKKDIPRYEYETIAVKEREVLRTIRDGSVVRIERVKVRTPVHRRKQVGTETIEELQRDPNGDIVQTHRKPIYGPGGPDIITPGLIGDNGMALHVLLQAGIDWKQVPAVEQLAYQLYQLVDIFGLPDHTWDLAWLTVGFAVCPGEDYKPVAEKLAHKLLMGQIRDGRLRGMWGPVCVNPGHLARLMTYEEELGEGISKCQKALSAERSESRKERIQEELTRLESRRNALVEQFPLIARQGLRFGQITQSFGIKDKNGQYGRDISVPGYPFSIYREVLADLESTALVLMALRVAYDNGVLPEKVVYPVKDDRDRPLVPDEPVATVLNRAAAAVVAGRKPDGTWDEMNVQQPTRFGKVGGGLPRPRDLVSRRTLLATLRGYAALSDVGAILGADPFSRRYGRILEDARSAALRAAEAYLKTDPLPPRPAKGKTSIPDFEADGLGGLGRPFGAAAALGCVLRLHGSPLAAERDLYKRLAARLLAEQNADGWWGPAGAREPHVSTSALADLWEDFQQSKAPRRPGQPKRKGPTADTFPEYVRRRHSAHWMVDRQRLGTLYAMDLLLQGVRPVVGAYWELGERASLAAVEAAARAIARGRNFLPAFAVWPEAGAVAAPVLVVSGTGAVADIPQGAREAVGTFLTGGGAVVVVTDPLPGGQAFVKQVKEKLLADLGLTGGELTAEDEPLKEALTRAAAAEGDDRPALRVKPTLASASKDGKLAVVYLLVTPRGGLTSLSPEQGGSLVAVLVEDRASDDRLDRSFPIALGAEGDLAEVRKQALADLKAAITAHGAGATTQPATQPGKGG